jgi:hypothetical protein
MHRVSFDRSLASAQGYGLRGSDAHSIRDRSTIQHFRRRHEAFSRGFGMLAQASGDVHRIPEQCDLPFRVAALADNDGSGVNAGTEIWHDTKFAPVGRGEPRHRVFDGEKAAQRLGISLRVAAQRPGDDHLVTDVGVHFAVMCRQI